MQTPTRLSTQHSSHHDEEGLSQGTPPCTLCWPGDVMEGLCPLLSKKEGTDTEKWFITICIHSTLQEFGEKNMHVFCYQKS